MFSTQSENCTPICQYFWHHIFISAELEEPKIGMWGKGLIIQSRLLMTLGKKPFENITV